jgi:hypothetical protein
MIKFKSIEIQEAANKLNTKLFAILIEMGWFCASRKLDFVLTETVTTKEHDEKLGRISTSHQEGRAVDVRTRDWSEQFIKTFVHDFEKKYNHLGATSKRDGKRRFIVNKSQTNSPHLHIQMGREFI